MHVWSCCRCRLSPRDIYLSELQPSSDALFSMPTIFNVVLLVVLFNLCTLIGLDARPHPNDFLVLKNLRNVILRSSDTTTRLTPRGEVAPATSFDQPIKITTIFDPLFSEPTFTGSTIFDPFHPSEAGRSIPATPKAAQLTPVSTGPDPINSDYITSSWDTGTGLATSITQLVTFYTPEFTVCPIRPVGSGYSLLAVQGAQNDTATPPYSNSSGPPTTTCSTHYTSAVTPVCRTTITPLGNFPITITDCKQNVTFSTDHGCTLLKNRMLVSKTTNYVAPWDSVVTGVPQGVVQAEVCQHGGPCTTYHELWGVRVVMVTLASTSTLEISAVITGVSFWCGVLLSKYHH